MQLTKEQFEYWRSLPETQAVLEAVELKIRALTDEIVEGRTISPDSIDVTAIRTISMVNRIVGLRDLLQYDFEE